MTQTRDAVAVIAHEAARAVGVAPPRVEIRSGSSPSRSVSHRRGVIMVDAAWLERVTTATLRRAVWHQVKTLAFVPDLWSSDDRLGPLRASFPGSSSEFDLLLDLALDIYLEGVIDFGLSVGRAATEDLRDGMAFVATVPERTWAELPTELQIVCAVATAGSDPGSWAPPLQACLRAFHWTRNLEVLIGTYRDLRDDVS